MKKKKKKNRTPNVRKINLRAGSKGVKVFLYEQNPRCDICGCKLPIKVIQLHHIYLIRHGFPTQVDHCTLLCPNCHRKFHSKFDHYLDRLFGENPNTNFLDVYNMLKNHLKQN